MNEYTTMKYVVAIKQKNRIEQLYFATDDRREAEKEYCKQHADNVELVRLYNRPQWNGTRRRAMLERRLLPNDTPIPGSVGMWIINQADSGCF